MSGGNALGRRYARALYDLAAEQNQADKVSQDLTQLGTTWDGSAELREVFANPSVSAERRRAIVEDIATRVSLSPLVKNILLMLSDRGRTRYLPDVIDAYLNLAEEKADRVRAQVITASNLPESYFTELQQTLEQVTGKKVTLVKKQDPTLIAGVVTRVGDKIFDGSLKNRLDELRDELLSA